MHDDWLERQVPFEVERAEDDGDGLTLEGYAAVFNSRTLIDSWEGRFYEEIAKGAFRKSLRERTPVLMFNHGNHPVVGPMPLGRVESAREDQTGLRIVARLHDNWLVAPVRDAIESGAVDGMSFRFQMIREDWDPAPPWEMPADSKKIPVRTLREVRCAECGPVVFPAYTDTTVGVRGDLADLARSLFHGAPAPGSDEPTRDTEPTPAPDGATSVIPHSERRLWVARLTGATC
jgi:HK97 family phage prohead protease